MLRIHERKIIFSENPICDSSQSNQMPSTDQITEIAPITYAPISELPSYIGTIP